MHFKLIEEGACVRHSAHDKKRLDTTKLAGELLHLNDEVAELQCLNAFLCCAFTAVMSSTEPLPEDVVQGAKFCAEMLSDRAWKLKQDIQTIHQRHLLQTTSS
jgi:hypothetical protein